MNKTITVPQNIAQEAIDVHEQKTSFADIGNHIVAQEAVDVHEQKTSFPGIIGNSIVAEEADEKYEQTTRFPGIIGNSIVAEETVDECEQKAIFPSKQSGQFGIIGMNSHDFIDTCKQCHAITIGKEIPGINSEITSAENKTGIWPSCNGATT